MEEIINLDFSELKPRKKNPDSLSEVLTNFGSFISVRKKRFLEWDRHLKPFLIQHLQRLNNQIKETLDCEVYHARHFKVFEYVRLDFKRKQLGYTRSNGMTLDKHRGCLDYILCHSGMVAVLYKEPHIQTLIEELGASQWLIDFIDPQSFSETLVEGHVATFLDRVLAWETSKSINATFVAQHDGPPD